MEPEDFEIGEEVHMEVAPRSKRGLVVSVRLPADEAEELFAVSKAEGKMVTQVVAEALRVYLSGHAATAAHKTAVRA